MSWGFHLPTVKICMLWWMIAIIWMNNVVVATNRSSSVKHDSITAIPTTNAITPSNKNDSSSKEGIIANSESARISRLNHIKDFVAPVNWENLECLSSQILRARNICIENKFNKSFILDSNSACRFYKQVMHCTKLLVIKAIKCQKQGPLDKSLNLETFTKFDTLVLHLCSPEMRQSIVQSIFDYNIECGQHLMIGIWSRHEGAIQMEHYITRQSLDINDYLCTDLSEFLMEEADHFFQCRHDLVITLYYSLSEILQCQAYLYIRNTLRHNDWRGKEHGFNLLRRHDDEAATNMGKRTKMKHFRQGNGSDETLLADERSNEFHREEEHHKDGKYFHKNHDSSPRIACKSGSNSLSINLNLLVAGISFFLFL